MISIVGMVRRAGRPARLAGAFAVAAAAFGGALLLARPAPTVAQEAAPNGAYAATIAEITGALGGVPDFVKALPQAALPGAWAEQRDMFFAGPTALDAKTKALISLAVAAQIPCSYCIFTDTEDAKRAGATQEEIAEAVTVAAMTRHWSTIFNGLQVDFETMKRQLGYTQ